MSKVIILVMIVALFSIFGRDRQYKIGKIVPGKTNIKSAISLLGTPIESKPSSFDKESTFYKWKEVSLVVSNDIVTSLHRAPASHETYLQFWRQHFKDYSSEFKRVNNDSLWQLTITDKNLSVIYDENSDQVTKVIYYAR